MQSANQSKLGLLPTCRTLLYKEFIHASVTGDTKRVGGPENWAAILKEFAELVVTDKGNNVLDVWLKIEQMEWKIGFAATMIDMLRDGVYIEEAAEALFNMGYDYVDNCDDHEEYLKKLNMVENEAKTLVVILDQYYKEYMLLVPEHQQKPRTEMDFEQELAVLRRHGYKINKNKNTVFEFCAVLNSFIDEMKAKSNSHGQRQAALR